MSDLDRLGRLAKIGWLAEQPEELRRWAARCSRPKQFARNALVFDADDEPDGIYGIADGAVEITFPRVADEPVTIHRAGAGFWVGDLALLAGTRRLVSVRSAADCTALFIPAREIVRLLDEQPRWWPCFYALSYENFSTAVQMLGEALALSPGQRVARRLMAMADDEGQVRISEEDLAKLVGVTRATLHRTLARLSEAGAIERGYRTIHIRSDNLAQFAELA